MYFSPAIELSELVLKEISGELYNPLTHNFFHLQFPQNIQEKYRNIILWIIVYTVAI